MIKDIIVFILLASLQFTEKVNGYRLKCSSEIVIGMESTGLVMALSEAIQAAADVEKNSYSGFAACYYNGFCIDISSKQSVDSQKCLTLAYLSILGRCFVKDNMLSKIATFDSRTGCTLTYEYISPHSLKHYTKNNYSGYSRRGIYDKYANLLTTRLNHISLLNPKDVSEMNTYIYDRPWLHYGLKGHVSYVNKIKNYQTQVSCSREVFIGSRAVKEIILLDERMQSEINKKYEKSKNGAIIYSYTRVGMNGLEEKSCLELAYQNLFKYCLIDEGKSNLDRNIFSNRKKLSKSGGIFADNCGITYDYASRKEGNYYGYSYINRKIDITTYDINNAKNNMIVNLIDGKGF